MESNPYHERERHLQVLGFQSYDAYLKSAVWKKIRRRVLQAATTCLRCSRHATTLHHASYDLETLRGDRVDTLVPACRRCHRQGERRNGLSSWEHLNHATVFLMTRATQTARRGRRRDKTAITWRTERVLPQTPGPFIKKRRRHMTVTKAVFDPTPRLRERFT